MSDDDRPEPEDFAEMLRNLLGGQGGLAGLDPEQLEQLRGLGLDPAMVQQMMRQLQAKPVFAERFLTHILTRNIRIEEDLIDQLFNSSEKRLARTLLRLARYGKQDKPVRLVPKISPETLAAMVGTTRSRVNFFLNKFKKLGFIEEHNGVLQLNPALLMSVPGGSASMPAADLRGLRSSERYQ